MQIRMGVAMKMYLIVGFLSLLLLPTAWASDAFLGRWDIVETIGSREYASWMEIRREGDALVGRVVPRSGHARPAAVSIKDGKMHVQVTAYRPGSPSTETYIAEVDGAGLRGGGADQRGREKTWTAVRAPAREEGSDRTVSWGEPIEIFNGNDLSGWRAIPASRTSNWAAVDGVLLNSDSGANIQTERSFRDFKLSLEYRIPKGSNSGIYLRGRYETQVMDDFGSDPNSRGNGGVYGYITPTENASKPAGEWNRLEAVLIGYRVTITLNGRTVIDGKLIDGITGGALDSREGEPGPLMIQGDHGSVEYRNIVVTPAR